MKSRIGIIIVFFCVGCVRFTPSRHAIVDNYGGNDPAIERVGRKVFEQYDQDERRKLQNLIDQRLRAALTGDNQRYRVGPGDTLDVRVDKFDEVSRTVEVEPSGDMSLPQIGPIRAAGRTREEIVQAIAEEIANYLVDPQVEVTIAKPRGKRVWLMGQVARPGVFPLEQPNYSLIDFLADTGNVRSIGGDVIYLFPAGQQKNEAGQVEIDSQDFCPSVGILSSVNEIIRVGLHPELYRGIVCENSLPPILEVPPPGPRLEIDMDLLFGNRNTPPLYVPLVSGDRIFVPPFSVQVFGEVINRTTVGGRGSGGNSNLFGRAYLMNAILEAGGLTYSADIENVEIMREIGGGKKIVLSLDLEKNVIREAQDLRLRSGDIITVPSAEGRFVRANVINWINSLVGVGQRVQIVSGSNQTN